MFLLISDKHNLPQHLMHLKEEGVAGGEGREGGGGGSYIIFHMYTGTSLWEDVWCF